MSNKLIFAEDIVAKEIRALIREVWDSSRQELRYSYIGTALDLYYYFCDTWNSRYDEFNGDVIMYRVGDDAKIYRVIKVGYKGEVIKLTHSHECFAALKTIYKTLDNFKVALSPIDVEEIYKEIERTSKTWWGGKKDISSSVLILFWQFTRLFEFNMFEASEGLSQEELDKFIAGCERIEDEVTEGSIKMEIIDERIGLTIKG
jgi:hypothetical protein